MVVASPWPCATSHSVIVAIAVGLVQAVQRDLVVGRVDHRAGAGVGAAVEVRRRLHRADDGQPERLGELAVAGVLAGHGHDRAGAVAGQHVVGDEHRQLAAVDRVDGGDAQPDAGLVPALGLAVQLRAAGGLPLVGRDRLGRGRRPPVQRGSVPSGHAAAVSAPTSGCSGASTM